MRTILNLLNLHFNHRRLQENKLQSLDSQLFLKLRSLKILDMSQNQLSLSLPHELFQSIYHLKGEKFIACESLLYFVDALTAANSFQLIYLNVLLLNLSLSDQLGTQ